MFHDILAQPYNHHSQDKLIEQQLILENFDPFHYTDLFSSVFEHSLDQLSQGTNKDTTQLVNIKPPKSQKPAKQKKKRIRKYISNNPNNKKGHWTHEQNLKYHYFLELHSLYFIDDQKRKTDKVFKSMASFIETRQAHQCRSHHQKVQKKWGSFPNILLNLRFENFKKRESAVIIKNLEQLGYKNAEILSEIDLSNEQGLYKKIMLGSVKYQPRQKSLTDEPRTEESVEQISQIQDKTSRCHKKNCMCLMMSETYEDQLEISC